MRHLIDQIGQLLSEGRGKRRRKSRMKKRGTAEEQVNRQIGADLRKNGVSYLNAIMGRGFDINHKPLFSADDNGALIEVEYASDHDYVIGLEDYDIEEPWEQAAWNRMKRRGQSMGRNRPFTGIEQGTVEAAIEAYAYNLGDKQRVELLFTFGPPYPGSDQSAIVEPGDSEREASVIWARKRKPFNPKKDLWPLIKKAAEVAGGPPEWEELVPEMFMTPEELYGRGY